MRLSVKGKVPLLLLGAVLLSMTWLGYWIGYVSYKSHVTGLQAQLERLMPTETHTLPYHRARHVTAGTEDAPLLRVRNFGNTKGENVYVVGSHGKLNSAQNRVNEIDSLRHAIGIHEGHANKISQHLNRNRDPTHKYDRGVGGGLRDGHEAGHLSNTAIREAGIVASNGDVNNDKESKLRRQTRPTDTPTFRKRPPLDQTAHLMTNPNHAPSNTTQVFNQAAVDEFQALRKRLHAHFPAEATRAAIPTRTAFRDEFLRGTDTFGKYYALVHSGAASRVHGDLHAKLRALPDTVPTEHYTFKAKQLPRNPRLRPSVANGHVGTAVHSGEVFVNGLYNGYKGESHRAVVPSTVSFNITGTEPPSNFTRTYILNAGIGVYSEETVSDTYTLTQRIYAHRKYSRLLVVEVDVVRQNLRGLLQLKVKLNRWVASSDITFLASDSGIPEVSYKSGHINSPETDVSVRSEVHVYYDHVPNELTPVKGAMRTKWVFLTSIGQTQTEALEAYKLGAWLARSNDELYAEHVRAWGTVWVAGRVDVVGNLPLAQALYGAFYYILSSMPLSEDPTSPFVGLSPSGLPFGDLEKDYQGHVFWDQETWMFPAVLPLWPSLGRLLLGTRRRTMDAASGNAQKNGHQGLQYPWESALTGAEVCPNERFSKQEIHISGDISLALLHYIYVTNDTSILREDQRFGYLLTGIAYFYASILKWNDTRGFYEIKGVIPPDEYHKNVNNSVYTNAIAKIALQAPEVIFKRANKTLDHFKHIAKDIFIPYSIAKKYHPEYDGYTEGTKVKQADAILLSYPLNIDMDISARRNDLRKYEKATDLSGPAMSWSMFTIGWLDVGDEARAETMFKRSFQYIKNEFQVWHEALFDKGATNFITGMGGFLQSVIYGYGGLRYSADRLDLNPLLPLDCTELHLTGVNYLGSSVNIFVQKDSIVVSLVARTKRAPGLVLYVYMTEKIHSLDLNHAVRIPRQHATITVAGGEAPG